MDDENLILHDPRPTRADALKNRDLLLRTAQALFVEHGAGAVSMSQIAEAAGVGKGTLYRHFENKRELVEALLDQEQRELQESMFARLRAGGPPLEHLRWFLTQVLAFVDRNRPMLCTGTAGERHSSLEHPAHRWWRQTIRGLLAQVGIQLDLDYATDVLYVLLDVHIVDYQRRIAGHPLDLLNQGIHALLDRLVA